MGGTVYEYREIQLLFMICSAFCIFNDARTGIFYGGLDKKEKCLQYNDGLRIYYGASVVMWILFGYSLAWAQITAA